MKPVNGVNARLVAEEYLIPVTGDGDEEEVSEATQDGGGVSQETPAEATIDEVGTSNTTIDFAEAIKKYESDINKIKSTFQKRESELLKEKTATERKLEEVLKSTMDEGDRKQYEQDKLHEELEKLRAERDEIRAESEQTKQFMVWRDYFVNAGIPPSKLKIDEGVPGLFGSGMAALQERIKELEANKTPAPKNNVQKAAKVPPEVAQSTSGKIPSIGNFPDAVKHFAGGDEEKFWRMAETGNANVLKVLNELSEK